MKNDKLKKGIGSIKEIKMTNDEKFVMLQNLNDYVEKTSYVEETKPIKSYFYNFYIKSLYLKPRFVYAAFSFFGIFFVGASVIFAASSIPGDILYPIKTKIVEPVQELLAVTPEAKAKLSAIKIEDTLKEAQILIKNNNLNLETRKLLEQELKHHTDNLNNLVNNQKEASSSKITSTKISLDNNVREYSKILDKMRENDNGKQKNEIELFNNAVNNTLNSTTTISSPTENDSRENSDSKEGDTKNVMQKDENKINKRKRNESSESRINIILSNQQLGTSTQTTSSSSTSSNTKNEINKKNKSDEKENRHDQQLDTNTQNINSTPTAITDINVTTINNETEEKGILTSTSSNQQSGTSTVINNSTTTTNTNDTKTEENKTNTENNNHSTVTSSTSTIINNLDDNHKEDR